MNYNRNNLDLATSPYLKQHAQNPIHWQEWSAEVLSYAQAENKPLFVSIGYATCHWCHVMAREAFSNQTVANYMNEHFVCIKVDRESRPDIDNFCMAYMQQSQGHGGWPLNIFMTPDVKPITALTYLPVEPRADMPGFLSVAHQVYARFREQPQAYMPFSISAPAYKSVSYDDVFLPIKQFFTGTGFGQGPQFPSHNTLLLLLYSLSHKHDAVLEKIMYQLLDVMATRGLHDHVQGGFYRYCVDASWSVPHFEKMLYDQAMLLWVYSEAYRYTKKESYRLVVEKLMQCIDETFFDNGLYVAAHDADTHHEEGATYVWTYAELKENLDEEAFNTLQTIYDLKENFGDKIHLVKKKLVDCSEVEKQLLKIRRQRPQPFVDRKKITSWNALLGVGMIMAGRALENDGYINKAVELFTMLCDKHIVDDMVIHVSIDTVKQPGVFLEDAAALLLLGTYIYEDTGEHLSRLKQLQNMVNSFNIGDWQEHKNDDFQNIPANSYDHPAPSSVSLAEYALQRMDVILGEVYLPRSFKPALAFDFYNVMVMVSQGYWHIVHAPKRLPWLQLPINSMCVASKTMQHCYNGQCQDFSTLTDLNRILHHD